MKSDDPSQEDTFEPAVEKPESSKTQESILSAAGAATTVNRAINDTAQKYLTAVGVQVDLADIQNKICTRPLLNLAIAAGVGFVVGGGMASKVGLALIRVAGRKAAAETATNFGHQILRQAD